MLPHSVDYRGLGVKAYYPHGESNANEMETVMTQILYTMGIMGF